MGFRTVYGNTISEDGWPMVDEGSCTWVTIPGTNPTVTIEIQNGQPLEILRAWVADINAYVSPVRDADTACWTATNSVATSNHLSGTAVDIDWNDHPMGPQAPDPAAGWSPDQIATIRDLLDFYEGTVFWGNDWNSPHDSMHFQCGYNTYQNPATADFIARKIRPDGFSTFRRDAPPAPAPVPQPAPPVMTVPLVQNADGTWGSPSPAWNHLIVRESSGNPTIIQQIIDVNSGGNEAEGLFQITPATWAAHGGLEFALSPRLATPQQQAIVAARIFTQNPTGSDWGAGLPGREDASQLAAGLVPIEGSDFMSALSDDEQRELLDLARQSAGYRRPSRSPLRWPNQGDVDTCAGFAWNADAFGHVMQTEKLAVEYGDSTAIANLYAVASTNEPGRDADKALATKILQKCNPTALNLANAQILTWLNAEAAAKK